MSPFRFSKSRQSQAKLRTFDGAVAIVTGGASGIGRAIGSALAQRRAEVIIADRQAEVVRQAAEEIQAQGGRATAVEVDVADFAAVHRLISDTAEVHGRLDYIFNNAGTSVIGDAQHYHLEDWRRVLDVNLGGVANAIQAAYPIMLHQGFGHIVNTASMAGLVPAPWAVSYTAAKHGVVGLSLALRVEAASFGVRVSVLCPGVVRTPILEGGGKYGKLLPPFSDERVRAWQRNYIERLWPITPAAFAKQVLPLVARNRAIIVAPRWWRAFWWLHRCSPAMSELLSRRAVRTVREMSVV